MISRLEAVLFDLDGVLVDSPLDLAAIKRELFGDASVFIIEGLAELPEDERRQKDAILLQRELEAAAEAVINPAVPELFSWLEGNDIGRGIITRNCREVVDLIIEKHGIDFGAVIARDDAPPKPDPASIYAACEKLRVDARNCVMVGDYSFDIEAGRNAGCRTVFLETEKYSHLEPGEDVRIRSLGELLPVLENWLSELRSIETG